MDDDDTDRKTVYRPLGPQIEPGSPDDWTYEQLDSLSAGRKPRRVVQPDDTVTLTREEAVRIAAALLFYLRGWDEDPAAVERSVPTPQLLDDQGHAASDVLDGEPFPGEVLFEADELWHERW
jgi:hypothetical protein